MTMKQKPVLFLAGAALLLWWWSTKVKVAAQPTATIGSVSGGVRG